MDGSSQAEVRELSGIDAALRGQIDQIMALLGKCGTNVEAVIREYGDGSGSAPVVSGAANKRLTLKATVDNNRIEEVRRALRSPSPRGAQTTGWMIRSDGSKDRLLSGPDDDPSGPVQKAERLIRQHLPPTRHGAVALARHVEVKVAMRMRESGSGHEVHPDRLQRTGSTMTGRITARWSSLQAGLESDGEHHVTVLATPDDVRGLVEQLRGPDTTEAHLVHGARPRDVDEWSGDETPDHQVTIGVHAGFGYMEFIDSAHVVQIVGDPESPEWHTHSSGYFNRGSGISVDTLTDMVTEFLTTGQLPTRVRWREHDDWTALRRRGSGVPERK
jgi:Immunity protein Imm1